MALVKGGFTAQGTSMAKWAADADLDRGNVAAAVLGHRNGPKAQALRWRAAYAAGVLSPEMADTLDARRWLVPPLVGGHTPTVALDAMGLATRVGDADDAEIWCITSEGVAALDGIAQEIAHATGDVK